MKTRYSSNSGIALVLVLTMLVLLSALIVAFMTSATNERTSTLASSSASNSRQIADMTVNMVMSQIREATTQPLVEGGKIPKETAAWASQPGAIRTFTGRQSSQKVSGEFGATFPTYTPGSDDTVFKLYSSDRMRVSSSDYEGTDLPQEVEIIENWDMEEPAKDHVDLNQPLLIPDPTQPKVVEPRYPIIDPRARFDASENPVSGAAPGIVDGFDMKAGIEDQEFVLESQAKVPYLPLPVKWLYVLADGSMGAIDRATPENPIVGRTAFWVDDESTKLNINTASEGTYWDTPTASSVMESGRVGGNKKLENVPGSLYLGAAQPVRGEYQRYPGHPATTSLSPVLGWLAGLPHLRGNEPTPPLYTPALKSFKEMIYQLSPFMPFGDPTSEGATVNPDSYSSTQNPNRPAPLDYATKRLYATVDELIFKSERTRGSENPVPQLNVVAQNPTSTSLLTPEAIEKVRFFLTTSSRSPELNLFGRPRMTIWPVHADITRRTSFDDIFAFTSTIGGTARDGQPFYFSRSDAKDNVTDFNPNNQRMYKYLQAMTGDRQKNIPGFGGNFAQKYQRGPDGTASERDQILTMMLDYMRTVNLVDTGTSLRTASGASSKFTPYTPFYGRQGYGANDRPLEWSGQVTPLQIKESTEVTTMGLGRFVTVSEAALIFYRKAGQPTSPMEAVLALEMATPMPGYPALKETFFTVVKAVRPTMVKIPVTAETALDIGFSTEPRYNINNVPSHQVGFGRGFMPIFSFAPQMHFYDDHRGPTNPDLQSDPNRNPSGTAKGKRFQKHPSTLVGQYKRGTGAPNDPQQTVMYYPYVSDAINLAATDKEFALSGGMFEVEIWTGEAPNEPNGDPRARLVQTLTLEFPAKEQVLPVPTFTSLWQSRFVGTSNVDKWNFIEGGDVVRSIEFTGGVPGGTGQPFAVLGNKGDLRHAMARAIVPKSFYEPRAGYFTKNKYAHGLSSAHGDPLTGHNNNSPLVRGGAIRGSKPPILPSGMTTGVLRIDGGPGDWDRGLSKHMSGAFANKVDEGNVFFNYSDSAGGRMPYFRGKGIEETGQSFFSPNRQISSAVMFGSLPTGIKRGLPWQTLLFRPDRETARTHPGAEFPQDHLFLDLFNMPVVEPYAISEPFSTAGKVNMNYVIAPFGYAKGGGGNNQDAKNERSYVRRDTALRGVLKSTKVMMVPTNQPQGGHNEDPTAVSTQFRFDIDLNRTLAQFEDRLKDPARGLFRSASEICEMDLFPRPAVGSNAGNISPSPSWDNFWNTRFAQTGDNMRERPYSHIYPRLTTKSNVYTIHMRCQVLKKAPNTPRGEWVDGRDQVLGEYRGSTTIERYIDPNDPDLKNYDAEQQSAEPYYRIRVVGSRQFTAR